MSKIKDYNFQGANIFKNLFISWLIPSLLYLTVFLILMRSSSVFNLLEIVFFRGGFTVLFSFVFLQYIYNKVKNHQIIYIISGYFLVAFLNGFPFKILALKEISTGLSVIENQSNFEFNLIFGLLMLVYTLSVHLFYLNDKKIKFLKQDSLEKQLNYQHLKNQLSPHFLFNNINVLTSLIEENPKKAIQFSLNLSSIYRYFLEKEKEDVVLLKDELDFAENYLNLLKVRYEEFLSYEITVDSELLNKYVVSTSLQQVLENVVKHNEVSKEHLVNISITASSGYLIISNNINHKIGAVQQGNGIKNIKSRYSYFSNRIVEVDLNEINFTIKLPLLNE